MENLTLVKNSQHQPEKVEINSWEQFVDLKSQFDSRSIVNGIVYFFDKKDKQPEDILNVITTHSEAEKIWCKVQYEGGTVQGYIPQILQKNLKNEHPDLADSIEKSFLGGIKQMKELLKLLSSPAY